VCSKELARPARRLTAEQLIGLQDQIRDNQGGKDQEPAIGRRDVVVRPVPMDYVGRSRQDEDEGEGIGARDPLAMAGNVALDGENKGQQRAQKPVAALGSIFHRGQTGVPL
jgi:hypothetical protein